MKMIVWCWFLLLVLVVDTGVSLNPYVDSYEPLNYRPVNVERQRRSINSNQPIRIRFTAHNRTLNLNLFPIESATSLFVDNHVLDVDGTPVNVEPSFLYEGYVEEYPSSRVYGSIQDGVFDGQVHLGDGHSFTIDKASKYFDVQDLPQSFHSIIYHDKDINHERMRVKREANKGSCALDGPTKFNMERIARSAELKEHASSWAAELRRGSRTKRTIARDSQGLYNVRTCSLYLQADHKLYEHIFQREGNRDPIRTREEIISLFYNHVQAVNEIYETTDFNGVKGINFVIQRTTIYTPETCRNGTSTFDSDNPFCEDTPDVSNFLSQNSRRNHSAFCLAYALTFRDFVGGTLGLAWVATPQVDSHGGICELHQRYNEGPRGWVYRSLNTGIVSLVNYGTRVPLRVSQLTLAHEIGHNFGSPHDIPQECQPGLPNGNFIMFASATAGDKPNNAKFSPCSIANISMVLHAVLQVLPEDPSVGGGPLAPLMKRNCFQGKQETLLISSERTSAFCGNQIREPGEECDCGFSAQDCEAMGDKCCAPREMGRIMKGPGPCRRKANAACSPSEGYCCNGETCSLYLEHDERECRQESECLHAQKCDGAAASCPPSIPKVDGLPCQDGTKVCANGNCNGSVCEVVGLKDCFLTDGKPEDLCFVACEKQGKCYSSADLPEFSANNTNYVQKGREGENGLVLMPGSPCNDYRGYCDIARRCRSIDSNGPLATLRNIFTDARTITSLTQWLKDYWWIVAAVVLVLLVLLAIFIKFCVVNTPSTNPYKPTMQRFYDTLTRRNKVDKRRQDAEAPAREAPVRAPRPARPLAAQPPPPYQAQPSAPPLPLTTPAAVPVPKQHRKRSDAPLSTPVQPGPSASTPTAAPLPKPHRKRSEPPMTKHPRPPEARKVSGPPPPTSPLLPPPTAVGVPAPAPAPKTAHRPRGESSDKPRRPKTVKPRGPSAPPEPSAPPMSPEVTMFPAPKESRKVSRHSSKEVNPRKASTEVRKEKI